MDSPGLIDSLLWDFGDGDTAYNDTSLIHAYDTPGRYSVTVKAFGCRTDETTIFDLVVLSDSLSPVTFNIAPDTGTIDTSTTLTFTDMSPGAAVKNWFWNFGDAEIGNDSIVTHKYADTGTYVVSLTIFNSCDSLKASDTIVVAEPPAAAPMKKARR
jgi:PKD repeat protein